MPIPAELLNEGEDVVADLRPHWSFMAGPMAFTVVAAAGSLAVFARWAVPSAVVVALLVLIAGALGWLVSRYARWATTSFVVTTDRLVLRSGVLGRHGREIPLERVNDLAFDQTLGERLVGCGRLLVESGGERGQETMPRVPRPAAVQRLIYAQIEAARRWPGDSSAPWSIPEQLEKLDDLCRRGIITRTELDAKRAELLRRW